MSSEAPFHQPEPQLRENEQMSVVFVGHVDHGKSTIIGRLLSDTNSLPKGKLEQIRENCLRSGKPFEYALLIDALKDEQAQSITIDSARVFFRSQNRNYIIIDAPGHIEFIKNMVTGASHAEAAVLVIDAQEGVQENSRRHGYLLWMLGIKQIVVVVNKMDLVHFDQQVFESITQEYTQYLVGLGVSPLTYIPVSGRVGDGVVQHSSQMPWYSGKTVLETLDSLEVTKPHNDLPARLPIQDVYKFSASADSRRMVAGTLSSGTLHVGDPVIIYPSGKRTAIKTFEAFNAPPKTQITSGQALAFTMTEQVYLRRGEMVAKLGEPAPEISSRLRVNLFWMGRNPLRTDKDYLFKLGTAKETARIETIHRIIDAADYSAQNNFTEVRYHDVAEVTLKLEHHIAFDTSNKLPDTSRFVLVDNFEISGGGIVIEALPDEAKMLREEVYLRDAKWIHGVLDPAQRAERYNQNSALVIITGPKGAGRKRLAAALEERLFKDGKMAYYLGIGSVLYGVNADLKRLAPHNDWHEHVRRFAQVCHLFLDAGLILIVTAVELTQEDLSILQAVVGEEKIETIWLGEEVTTDLPYDFQMQTGLNPLEATTLIKTRLQQRGFIFKAQ